MSCEPRPARVDRGEDPKTYRGISEYPVILSVEMHCSPPYQKEIANILRTELGDKLALLDDLKQHNVDGCPHVDAFWQAERHRLPDPNEEEYVTESSSDEDEEFEEPEVIEAVTKVKEHITAGDVFQLVLSIRMEGA